MFRTRPSAASLGTRSPTGISSARAIGNTREIPVEIVVNGKAVARQTFLADGKVRELKFEVPVKESSWIAARTPLAAHTNPVFALVGNKPVRASRSSAEWCLNAVNQCWTQKSPRISQAERPAGAEGLRTRARSLPATDPRKRRELAVDRGRPRIYLGAGECYESGCSDLRVSVHCACPRDGRGSQVSGQQVCPRANAATVQHRCGPKRRPVEGSVGGRIQGPSRLLDPVALAHADRARHARERRREDGNEGRRHVRHSVRAVTP